MILKNSSILLPYSDTKITLGGHGGGNIQFPRQREKHNPESNIMKAA